MIGVNEGRALGNKRKPLLAVVGFAVSLVTSLLVSAPALAQLRANCAESEINESQMTLAYVGDSTRKRISVCFEDQHRALASMGFAPRIETLSLRIFTLEQLIENTSVFAKGLSVLVTSKKPEDVRALKEFSQMRYVRNLGTVKPEFVEDPITFFDGFIFHQECGHNNEGCTIRTHIEKNIVDLQRGQKAMWETIKSTALSNLNLQNGKIPPGLLGSREERDFSTVEIASKIVRLRPTLDAFSSAEQATIQGMANIYEKTIADFYSGANQKARVFRLHSLEFTTRAFLQVKSVDEAIRNETFLDPSWRGGRDVAEIKAENSLSPLLAQLGPGSKRIIKWPWGLETEPNGLAADLGGLRVSQMVDAQGTVRAIEVIARDHFDETGPKNEGWEPFVYEKQWGRWFPSQSVRGQGGHAMPVKNFCIQCHATTAGTFSPFPRNVRDANTLTKIGYVSPRVVQDLMRFAE